MRIVDQVRTGEPIFSFEFFPPKTAQGEVSLFQTIENLRPLAPAFVSVTYGAGGATRRGTVDLVGRIQQDVGIEAMAHLTCIGADEVEITSVLNDLQAAGIHNVLALRGDRPRDPSSPALGTGAFAYADELVAFIRRTAAGFCIGGACYPEGHPECDDVERDLGNLVRKVEAGTDFLISQLFFNNDDFLTFKDRARRAGITVPILAGIMPITNVAQIQRITSLCGAGIPDDLRRRLAGASDDDAAARAIGIEHSSRQCASLLHEGVDGIHFYTLNQSMATRAILEEIRKSS